MASKNNFQEILFQEVIEFLRPISDTNGDPESIVQLFRNSGWDIDTMLGGNNDIFIRQIGVITVGLERVKDLLEKPPGNFQNLIGEIENVAKLFTAIKELANATNIPNISLVPRINELPVDAINLLLARYFYVRSPFLYAFLELVGVISIKAGEPILLNGSIIHIPADSVHFYFNALEGLLSNPAKHFKDLYWPAGIPNLSKANETAQGLFPKIARLLGTLNLNTFVGRGIGPFTLSPLDEQKFKGLITLEFPYNVIETGTTGKIMLTIGLLPEDEGGPGIYVIPSGIVDIEIAFEQWKLKIGTNGQMDGFIVKKNGFEIYQGNTNLTGIDTNVSIEKISNDENRAFLVGGRDATRFEIGNIAFGGGLSINAGKKEFKVFSSLSECHIAIKASDGDPFLSTLLGSNGINIDFDFKIVWSNLGGFYIEGSSGLEVTLPTHISLGPLEVLNVVIALSYRANELPLELSASLKNLLGPLEILVKNIGLKLDTTFSNGDGNIGPIDFRPTFKPPTGLGITINTKAVQGSGSLTFNVEKQEYLGDLFLTIAGKVTLNAIGIVTTKMPDGSKGYSLLIIITAGFNPPFQLGYGFTLNGVGGLLGLHRTVMVDSLREGVRTGTINGILFPENVKENIQSFVSDISLIFPPYPDRFLIGPMAKIGWGTPTLVTLSVGLVIEIPGNIALLGVLRVLLPDEKNPLVRINVAFVGIVDFTNKLISFDASLFDSRLLETMTLEGDMAVRLKWGDRPDFLLTVGGFHPSYTPPPLALPALRRLSISILNTPDYKIGVECYQAITSNTVQFGARAYASFDLKACSIKGEIAFDALFRFSPFYFIIQVSASFSLRAIGMDMMSVRVRLSLEGPTPWRAKGTGSVSLWFFEVSADFDHTWGEERNTALPDITVLDKFLPELKRRENWLAESPINRSLLVSLREIKPEETPADSLIVHPSASLVFRQQFVPLNFNLQKVGSQKPSDVNK
ncbi:MAG: DUF6603 domain-containing protein, partial [Cyclobacteriaceae bacterium]